MNWRAVRISTFIFLSAFTGILAQEQIVLDNPSFEGVPHQGGEFMMNRIISVSPFNPIPQWTDCGFKLETPPDLHGNESNFFGVNRKPQSGNSFLGMVVRYNDTWERVSQELKTPLEAGKCYKISIYLARDTSYKSATREDERIEKSFSKPCVLRIHGGNGFCSAKEMLSESVPISNDTWARYDFIMQPKQTWKFIELEAFYKTPVLFPYNGNILLDNASPITVIPCPNEPPVPAAPIFEEVIAAEEVSVPETPKPGDVKPPSTPKKQKEEVPSKPQIADAGKSKILKELDGEKITEGQVIQIEKLFFKADQSIITHQSHEVLDEVYDFLVLNPNVTVEIGGHTNGKPAHQYCDSLSTVRAQSVAHYLINKGVQNDRIVAKGYGKRKPIASNRTNEGRRKNQRVEIKILSLDGKTG